MTDWFFHVYVNWGAEIMLGFGLRRWRWAREGEGIRVGPSPAELIVWQQLIQGATRPLFLDRTCFGGLKMV